MNKADLVDVVSKVTSLVTCAAETTVDAPIHIARTACAPGGETRSRGPRLIVCGDAPSTMAEAMLGVRAPLPVPSLESPRTCARTVESSVSVRGRGLEEGHESPAQKGRQARPGREAAQRVAARKAAQQSARKAVRRVSAS